MGFPVGMGCHIKQLECVRNPRDGFSLGGGREGEFCLGALQYLL